MRDNGGVLFEAKRFLTPLKLHFEFVVLVVYIKALQAYIVALRLYIVAL